MLFVVRVMAIAGLVMGLAGGFLVEPGLAQQPPKPPPLPPPPSNQPTQFTQSSGGAAIPPVVVSPTVVNPSAFSPAVVSPFGYFPRQTPVNGYLTGAADVTTANAQYQLTIQQAKSAQEQARQSMIDTRRKMIEQQRWEQATTPTLEDIRQQNQQLSLNRARNNPPLTEIWSGQALNDLFQAIQRGHQQGIQGPPVPLSPDLLSRINVSSGSATAGVGALRDLNAPKWPLALRSSQFLKGRTTVENLANKGIQQAGSGSVDVDVINDLNSAVRDMQRDVERQVDKLTPSQYIQAMRFLGELNDSFRVFQDPNVANYFNGKFRAQGATVGELVQNMTAQGLRFAPAASGGEPSYTALHSAMITYDFGMSQTARR
jgi:hypothetical protein